MPRRAVRHCRGTGKPPLRPGAGPQLSGPPGAGRVVLEQLVSRERSRLVGGLARWCGDVELAEDAFSDAVLRALQAWQGEVPRDPAAWLVTAARNRARDLLGAAERQRTRALSAAEEAAASHPARHLAPAHDDLRAPTDRDALALLFAVAHPAIDASVHAPLILTSLLGSATSEVAAAFAVPTPTMAKRLVRAKRKIRDAGIPIAVPDRLPTARLGPVLEALYGAAAVARLRADPDVDGLGDEAVHLSQLLVAELPHAPEARALAALLLFLRSRARARVRGGVMVPLDEQDPELWDTTLVDRAEGQLRRAIAVRRGGPPGRFELEAAIQSAHCARRHGGPLDELAVAQLHEALAAVAPSRGAQVARAVARARVAGAAAGLSLLAEVAAQAAGTPADYAAFQPFHAARAHLLAGLGFRAEAADAYTRALELTVDAPSRRHLRARLDAVRP